MSTAKRKNTWSIQGADDGTVTLAITVYVQHKCETLIQHGHPSDVKYYREAARQALQSCINETDAEEFWPFGENTSALCYAVWRVEAAQILKEKRRNKTLNFNCTKEEIQVIHEITLRALTINRSLDKCKLMMDIEACHSNGNPLDLAGLLSAEISDFVHDLNGIIRNIDRKTGRLHNWFVPRHSKRGE